MFSEVSNASGASIEVMTKIKSYIDKIFADIEKEISLYQEV